MTTHALGIDIGGTFTDVVLADGSGGLFTSKVLTTPDDLTRGCLEGLESVLAKAGVDVPRLVGSSTRRRRPRMFCSNGGRRPCRCSSRRASRTCWTSAREVGTTSTT